MRFVVYGKPDCVWCDKAKALLTEKGFEFGYIDITVDRDAVVELTTKVAPGAKTVPVVIMDGDWVGGYQELAKIISLWEKDVALIRKILKAGETVTVKFVKKDGTERVMPCTTNFQFIPTEKHPAPALIVTAKKEDPNLFKVFDLSKGEWRSFKAQTLLGVA